MTSSVTWQSGRPTYWIYLKLNAFKIWLTRRYYNYAGFYQQNKNWLLLTGMWWGREWVPWGRAYGLQKLCTNGTEGGNGNTAAVMGRRQTLRGDMKAGTITAWTQLSFYIRKKQNSRRIYVTSFSALAPLRRRQRFPCLIASFQPKTAFNSLIISTHT